MSATLTKTILGGLLPLLANPVALAVVGVGAVALTIYSMLPDDDVDKDNGSNTVPNGCEPLPERLDYAPSTVPVTVGEPLETVAPTVSSTDEEALEKNITNVGGQPKDPGEAVSPEISKKELIRQAMSELGKRSAAARANKKNSRRL